MVVDSSALIAVLTSERGYESLEAALIDTDRPVLSAATLVEASMVVYSRGGPCDLSDLDEMIANMGINCVAVDHGQALVAREAFVLYGKGRSRAALNFGDCFSYALAKTRDQPLLFAGDDFTHTDVRIAAPAPGWS